MYKEVFRLRMMGRRKELGYSQNDVSKDTEINQSSISKYENGTLEPNLETLGKLANYYEVSIDWLLGNPYHEKEGNMIKAALKTLYEETIRNINGAFEQEFNKEEMIENIIYNLEKDYEATISKFKLTNE